MRRACLVILLSLIVGCTGLLQNIGARIVTRRFTAEFDLDDTQAEATRASVDRLIAKAPSVIGPRFDFIVASVDRAIAKGLTERDLIGVWRQVDQLLDEVAGHIIDEASPILATLRDEQIDHAHVRFEKRFDEVREKLAEPADERLEKRQDAFAAAIEEWTGDLSPDQEKALRAYVTRFPDDGALQLAADEAKSPRSKRSCDDIKAPLRCGTSFGSPGKSEGDWGPEARTLAERRAQSRKTLLYVYGLINAKQKDHVSQHLHDLHEKVKRFLGIAGS